MQRLDRAGTRLIDDREGWLADGDPERVAGWALLNDPGSWDKIDRLARARHWEQAQEARSAGIE